MPKPLASPSPSGNLRSNRPHVSVSIIRLLARPLRSGLAFEQELFCIENSILPDAFMLLVRRCAGGRPGPHKRLACEARWILTACAGLQRDAFVSVQLIPGHGQLQSASQVLGVILNRSPITAPDRAESYHYTDPFV